MSAANTERAVEAILRAARTEHDFADWLADVLCKVAAQLGSADALVEGRPGSWEAEHVLRLVEGTAGPYLDSYRTGRAKLTDAQVREIRDLYEPGVIGRRQLAAEFGVSASTISAIVTGKTWRWLS
jgi:hypothetical protein